MNVTSYYESLTNELNALKNRVRDFIADRHWLTDGEWKESVLRSMLSERLPQTVKVGRGFVLTETGPTSQCDILIYKASSPILFRDGDLVFITPDAVLGVIEVKSKVTKTVVRKVTKQFEKIGEKIGQGHTCFFGLFAYESDDDMCQNAIDVFSGNCSRESGIISVACFGASHFVRWWKSDPECTARDPYCRWHAYRLDKIAPGYFIANVVSFVCPDSISKYSGFWFPKHSKEYYKIRDKAPALGFEFIPFNQAAPFVENSP